MLNSYNSPPLSRPQRIRCEWLSLYVIFGILQFLFISLTDSCYLFFTLEWFLFSCLDPDLHKKYEHSYFNLITIAKYLPKCLFLFGQTNRSKCICLQPGKLCFAHLTSAKKKKRIFVIFLCLIKDQVLIFSCLLIICISLLYTIHSYPWVNFFSKLFIFFLLFYGSISN